MVWALSPVLRLTLLLVRLWDLPRPHFARIGSSRSRVLFFFDSLFLFFLFTFCFLFFVFSQKHSNDIIHRARPLICSSSACLKHCKHIILYYFFRTYYITIFLCYSFVLFDDCRLIRRRVLGRRNIYYIVNTSHWLYTRCIATDRSW